MKKLIVLGLIVAFCSFPLLWGGAKSEAQPPQPPAPEQQEGVETLTRGPMHEAYAAPQALNPAPSPIVPKKPPEAVSEMPPDQKPEGNHVVWISGYWAWDDEPANFIWVSGFWHDVPPDKRWVPGHWMEHDGGWQWSSGMWAGAQQTTISYVPVPPPSLESGPTIVSPGVDYVYSPGSWIHVERTFRWRPGFWVKHRPNWVFVPAHYAWTPGGCIFVDGYWDYEITRRGLLFCPVRFTANVWLRPNWRLHHHYIVYPDMFVGSLFVRVDYHRYCFGDYFGAKHLGHGYIPWIDYRLHKNIPGPLYQQFVLSRRVEVNFERDLRKLYDDRRLGLALRPAPPWRSNNGTCANWPSTRRSRSARRPSCSPTSRSPNGRCIW